MPNRRISFLLVTLIALSLVFPWVGSVSAGLAQTSRPDTVAAEKAQALLAGMTPEERVGQLFLVGFNGEKVEEGSPIDDLITQYHVGGVVLLRKNDNFSDQEDVLAGATKLTRALQQAVADNSREAADAAADAPEYVPLFIGISQEGDLYPNDQILSGLTQLPDLMAIGAAWSPDLAREVGKVMGSELSALGINLFLGPSLDVLDVYYTSGGEDLGVRSFGGDPFWVGELGKAYIEGLHQGSDDRMAVIAKHFPGQGSSDRQPETEIATVRKTFDQLKQIELAPFFAVTAGTEDSQATADGVLVSHIRYQGFQGNIRQSTLPLSFDRDALNDILSLDEFVPWRESGGLLVSDDLGSPAIKRYFDPNDDRFDARLVARDAFLAGNDLLYADNFIASGDADATITMERTLEFFTQKYREDAAFAQRVDSSVTRILTMKYRLYPTFDSQLVAQPESGLDHVGQSQQVTFDVASKAVTLISPTREELATLFPRPPQLGERIVFFTDTLSGRQCTTCADLPALSVDAIQTAVVRLYGPQAGGQISQNLMTSYSFTDLWRFLNQQEDVPPIENDLRLADWVVVAALNSSTDRPESEALRLLLSERYDLLRDKHVIVFAFNAPYYLDATDISKLTAYYGLYSKAAPFAEVAARVLFQELSPAGALPVSVPGTGYDLITATKPDPSQVISLTVDVAEETMPLASQTPEPTPIPTFKVGDTIPLKTGVILDTNRHVVPDGTPVHFMFTIGGDATVAQTVEAVTVAGVARASYRIDRAGLLEITANSDPAYNSDRLQLDITGEESAAITAIVPTAAPTETLQPTETATPSATPSITPTPAPEPRPGLGDWVLASLVILGSAALGLWLGVNLVSFRWGVRWALCILLGGFVAYNYLALELPGGESAIQTGVTSGTVFVTLVGVIVGAAAGGLWWWLAEKHSHTISVPK